MKNILLILNALLLIMTLSIVIMPQFWIVSVVTGAGGVKGVAFPIIWTVYAGLVFFTSAFTFSWLVKR